MPNNHIAANPLKIPCKLAWNTVLVIALAVLRLSVSTNPPSREPPILSCYWSLFDDANSIPNSKTIRA